VVVTHRRTPCAIMLHVLSNRPLQCLQLRRLKIWAHLAIFLCTFVQSGLPATIPCYFPDGTVFDGGISCLTNGTNSMCCASGDVCTTSGWCLGSSGYLYRGGCTDRSWISNACMSICKGITFIHFCSCTNTRERVTLTMNTQTSLAG
jgi:hypothetical protein